MRLLLATAALIAAVPLHAQIKTPDRPVTDPKALTSPANPQAKPVPLEDLAFTRATGSRAWSPDGRHVFLTTNLTGRMNIWRVDTAGSWPVQLTQSDEAQGALVVSPDGGTLYFQQDRGGDELYDIYAVPTRGGAVVNLTNTADQREADMMIAPGGKLAAISTKRSDAGQVNLTILDLATGKQRPLIVESDPQYRWYAIGWTEGGKALVAERSNTDDTEAALFRIDAATGARTAILEKRGTVYQGGDVTPDGRSIAVSTNEGTGQLRAGVYDTTAKRFRWLKPTVWEQSAGDISPDGKTMTVRTVEDGRATLSLVDLATLAERPLPLDPGQNTLGAVEAFAPDGRHLLALHSGADTPAEVMVVDTAAGGTARPLTNLAMGSLTPANLPKSQIVTYKSYDGTLVSAIVTMPFNLKRDGSNPAIIVPHGGPTGQSQDGFNRTATALASRGYIVVQPNFRGSTGYGQAFQTANIKDLGGGDLKDTIAAKGFLVASGYVDPKRVGITGGSYGGYMTLMALAKAPDEFAAGVQVFGIINWHTMYETSDALLRQYLIALLGDPVKDKGVYDAASPMTYIKQVKAPLLSLQGERDIRVPVGQAKEVEAALKARGTIAETYIYPLEGHGFQKRENQVDSLKRTVDWFDRHLKSPTR